MGRGEEGESAMTSTPDYTWPKHPDGRNMKMGEMSREQQLAILRASCAKLKEELESPAMQAQMSRILNTDPPQRQH